MSKSKTPDISLRYMQRLNWYGTKPLVAKMLTMPLVGPLLQGGARLLLPDRLVHRLPVSVSYAHYRLANGAEVMLLNPLSDIVAKDIYWGKGEPVDKADRHVLRLLEILAKDADHFADIGAYSGLFALVAACSNAALRAVTFEIVPENHETILRNVEANGFGDRIEARLVGLSCEKGSLRMPDSTGMMSRPSAITLNTSFDTGIEVPLNTLDSQGFEGRLLMKLDVETFEWDVLRGGKQTVERLSPEMICEILPRFQHCEELTFWLSTMGYRFFVATGDGFTERPIVVTEEKKRDWVFSQRDIGDLYQARSL